MFWKQGQLIHNGKYRIEKYLGGGGFALTYLATHTKLNRYVVVKTPNLSVQNDPDYPKYVQRFIKEGRILAQICADFHPNIVQVIDLFQDNSCHCLVMQYIPGMNLWNLVKQRGKLPESEAVKYIRQIGLALVKVHQKNLLHLDVTPPNIMITSKSAIDKAVLIDFGIAADMSIPSTLSRSFGNKAFAPYELIRQGVRHPTVDVYCLAASLYYAVTGEMPTNSLARKWEEEELISPQQYTPNLSKSCCNAILKGMALEAKDRPQTMQEWLNDLIPKPSYPQEKRSIVQLKSDVGVDYSNLEQLLKAQNWREADEETTRLMLKVANREAEGWLDDKQIDNFPCADLRTIDQLWVKYSNGHFGFSVQKDIWLRLASKVDSKTEKALGDTFGWRKDNKWLHYDDIIFNLNAPKGHLPTGVEISLGLRIVGTSWSVVYMLSHFQTCKI